MFELTYPSPVIPGDDSVLAGAPGVPTAVGVRFGVREIDGLRQAFSGEF